MRRQQERPSGACKDWNGAATREPDSAQAGTSVARNAGSSIGSGATPSEG